MIRAEAASATTRAPGHVGGSPSRKGPQDSVPFNPYFTAKDSVGMGVFLIVWAGFVFYAPDYLGHPDNYIEADSLVTPPHIVPEWYFLPFYAILRAFTADVWVVMFANWISFGIIDAKFFGVEMPADVMMSHQERAYTSPIWYTP